MCVCVCVCVACVHACMSTCECVCTHIRMLIIYMFVHTHIYVFSCMCAYIHKCVSVCEILHNSTTVYLYTSLTRFGHEDHHVRKNECLILDPTELLRVRFGVEYFSRVVVTFRV